MAKKTRTIRIESESREKSVYELCDELILSRESNLIIDGTVTEL